MTEMKLLLHLVLLTVCINVIISHPTNHIVKNQFLLLVNDQVVVCPDNSTCADNNTCCKLLSGGYGCCPLPNAVCCSDGEHCCPNDYACTTDGRCTDNQNKRPVDDVVPVVQTAELSSLQNSKASSNGMCTERVCNAKQTCCLYSNSTTASVGCCDMYEAVCCGDQMHCCPKNHQCGQNNGECYPNDLHTTIDKPFPASSIKPQWLQNIICGNGVDECPDYCTCCETATNKYDCCPMQHAVCCQATATCCPNGYTCEDNGTCSKRKAMNN